MIETPHIVQTSARLTAVIPLTIPKADIQAVMGPGVSELMATIAAQGVAPAGPWFTHHLKIDPEIWDFEISVPVASQVTAAGRVRPGVWPAMRVARTVYHGPYQGLGDGWGACMQWIAANGHTPAPDVWECYLVGPASEPDPANWRTELNRPLVG